MTLILSDFVDQNFDVSVRTHFFISIHFWLREIVPVIEPFSEIKVFLVSCHFSLSQSLSLKGHGLAFGWQEIELER